VTSGEPRSGPTVGPFSGGASPLRWRRRVDAGWRATPAGLVLLPADRSDPVTVAGSAVAVCELLDRPITEEALAGRLAERFELDPGPIGDDLRPLLAELLELGAVETVD
jgi:hypothetical protein